MSVTQYIGARYVPIFAEPDQWTPDRAYEPLTIVLHEGASFTSKQAVPIGIEITNTQFWACTGNYNAQVEAYRQEVGRVSGEINEIADQQDAQDAAIDANATAIETLAAREKHLIIIGDSWSINGRTLTKKTAAKLGIKTANVHNYSSSGIGFLKEHASGKFADKVNQAISELGSTLETTPVYIYILGGTNDYDSGFTTASQYASVINSLATQLKTAFKNCELQVFFMQGKTSRSYPIGLIKNVQSLCAESVQVNNAAWPINFRDYADALHLNETGDDKFSSFIASCFGIGTFEAYTDEINLTEIAQATFPDADIRGVYVRQTWNETSAEYYLFVRLNAAATANTFNAYMEGCNLGNPLSSSEPNYCQGQLLALSRNSVFIFAIQNNKLGLRNHTDVGGVIHTGQARYVQSATGAN